MNIKAIFAVNRSSHVWFLYIHSQIFNFIFQNEEANKKQKLMQIVNNFIRFLIWNNSNNSNNNNNNNNNKNNNNNNDSSDDRAPVTY